MSVLVREPPSTHHFQQSFFQKQRDFWITLYISYVYVYVSSNFQSYFSGSSQIPRQMPRWPLCWTLKLNFQSSARWIHIQFFQVNLKILSSTPRSTKWSLISGFQTKILDKIINSPCVLNNLAMLLICLTNLIKWRIWWRVQIVKLLIIVGCQFVFLPRVEPRPSETDWVHETVKWRVLHKI